MSENEGVVGKEALLEDVESEQEEPETTTEESKEDSKDWEAEATKWERMAKANKKKLDALSRELSSDEEKEAPKAPKQTEGLDYGQKAFLQSHELSIKSSEFGFVEKALKESGMSLDKLLENGYFVAELKELREAQETKDAIPKGSSRSGSPSKDSVDYYLKKGEIPTDKKLRKEYLDRKYKSDTGKSAFAPLS